MTKPRSKISSAATLRKRKTFLKAYARLGNISGAAAIAGIGRQTHYDWIAEDSDYKKAFAYAREDAADKLEQELRRRAIQGTLRPVFHNGKKVGSVRVYSDSVGMFLLRALRPEIYRERYEISGPSSGAIPVSITAALDRVYGEVQKFYGEGSAVENKREETKP